MRDETNGSKVSTVFRVVMEYQSVLYRASIHVKFVLTDDPSGSSFRGDRRVKLICESMTGRLLLSAILFLIAFGLTTEARAQSAFEAGARFGDNISVDLALPISKAPRLHGAVYLDRFGVGAYGNWVFRLKEGPKNLRFYLGGGPELFFEHQFDIAVAGDVGVEWAFDELPVTVGFDWRPSLRLTNGSGFHSGNWGFTVRYRFGGESIFTPAD